MRHLMKIDPETAANAAVPKENDPVWRNGD